MSDIRLEGVSKRYGPVAAADNVDLAVAQGEFVTILGPSGSGKTTLLSLIAGLNRPTAGRIFIGGRDVTEAPAQERNIGLVFQSYALFPHMTVLENVLFPLGVRKIGGAVARGQALDALKLVRLEGLQERRPSQLSGGQQQRVALARAIVFKPDILLLDEPLGALDRKLREELQVELKQLQRTLGTTRKKPCPCPIASWCWTRAAPSRWRRPPRPISGRPTASLRSSWASPISSGSRMAGPAS